MKVNKKMLLRKRKSKFVKNWKMNSNQKFKNLLEKKIKILPLVHYNLKKIKIIFKNLIIHLLLLLKKVRFLNQRKNLINHY